MSSALPQATRSHRPPDPVMLAPLTPLLALSLSAPPSYDVNRRVNIVKELVGRSFGVLPAAGARMGLDSAMREREKASVLQSLAPFGDPALGVPTSVFEDVDACCRRLERVNPVANRDAAAIKGLQGAWRVRYSNSPPPSNGARLKF